MKKLIFLLLCTVSIYGQTTTGQEQEFDYGIKNNSAQTITTPPYLTTTGMDGTQGKIPSAYIAKTADVADSLASIQKYYFDNTKKWVIFGDSFSNQITENDYPYYVIQDLKLTGTVTNAVPGDRIQDQLAILKSNLTSNPNYLNGFDILSVLVGVNDFAGSYLLGSRKSLKTDLNFAGYLKDFIETALTANPNIQIYLMTPTEADGNGALYNEVNLAGWSLRELSVLIGQISSDYGLQCIDLYSLCQFNKITIPHYTTDLLHPNSVGVKFIADAVSSAFRNRVNKGKEVDLGVFNLHSGYIPFVKNGTLVSGKLNTDFLNNVTLTADAPEFTILADESGAKQGVFNFKSGAFGSLEAYFLMDAFTAELRTNVGRTAGWGGFFTWYVDTVEKMRLTNAGNLKINNLSGAVDGNIVAASDGTIKRGTPLGSNAYTSTDYLPLSGGTLTGIVTAPTAPVGANTTQIATTAFVQENKNKLQGYTVATLPSGTIGDMAYVTDASGFSYNTVVVGGGSGVTIVFFDGTNWRAH